jgi:hypothetical protein
MPVGMGSQLSGMRTRSPGYSLVMSPGALRRRVRGHGHHDVARIAGSAPGTADDESPVARVVCALRTCLAPPYGSAAASKDYEPCLPIPPTLACAGRCRRGRHLYLYQSRPKRPGLVV